MKKVISIFLLGVLFSCQTIPSANLSTLSIGKNPQLPEPSLSIIPTVSIAKASQWPENMTPIVNGNFAINLYSKELTHPRWLYVLPNGDVLVSQSNKQPPKKAQGLKDFIAGYIMKRVGAGITSPDKITLLRDKNDDGVAELAHDFLTRLHSPFGMALIGNDLYVANTDAILRFRYELGDLSIDTKKYPPEKIVDLPEGEINAHWTKNVIASKDGKKLYVTVGSNSNIGEHGLDQENERALIFEVDLKTKQKRIYASGLRNPVGLAWHPTTGELFTVVNERDELGNDLVPDYLTSVHNGDFFGWPYVYYKNHKDPRVKEIMPNNYNPRSPDYALGAHVAALGLVFSDTSQFSSPYNNGVFISEHGSWNRKPRSGYKVVYVSFKDNEPQGLPIDIVTNFVVGDEAYGRPVGLAIDKKGNLLIADDVGNRVWRVTAKR